MVHLSTILQNCCWNYRKRGAAKHYCVVEVTLNNLPKFPWWTDLRTFFEFTFCANMWHDVCKKIVHTVYSICTNLVYKLWSLLMICIYKLCQQFFCGKVGFVSIGKCMAWEEPLLFEQTEIGIINFPLLCFFRVLIRMMSNNRYGLVRLLLR